MDRRAPHTVIARIVATATLALLAATPAGAETLRAPVDVARTRTIHEDPPVRVLWPLRMVDLLSCRSHALRLRQAQAMYGPQIVLRVVALEMRPEVLESYLRNERLRNVEVEYLSTAEFQDKYPDERPAILAVMSRNSVSRFVAVGDAAPGQRPIAEFEGVLRNLFTSMAGVDARGSSTRVKGGN